jgi:hypothetical protein
VGHVFGLQDGGPNNPHQPPPGPAPGQTPFPAPLPMVTQDPWSCSGSVMHSYGCSDPDFPSAADRLSLEVHIPDAGTGFGFPGPCKLLCF